MFANLMKRPFINIFLFSLFYSLYIFVSKLALNNGADPVVLMIHASVVIFIVIPVYVLLTRHEEVRSVGRAIIWGLVISNLFSVVGTVLSSVGFELTSAINAGFLSKFTLVTTLLLAIVVLKERFSVHKALMAVVMFVGVYFLTTEGKMIVPKVGDLLIIGAAMMWSAGAVTMRLLLRGNKVSGETATFVRSLITLPVVMFVVLVAPVLPSFAQGVFLVNPFEFGYLSYGLIRGALSAITLIFLNRSLKISSASYNTMMSMMVPVMVSVLALLFLGERVSVMQALGGGLIILSGVGTHYLRVYDD